MAALGWRVKGVLRKPMENRKEKQYNSLAFGSGNGKGELCAQPAFEAPGKKARGEIFKGKVKK